MKNLFRSLLYVGASFLLCLPSQCAVESGLKMSAPKSGVNTQTPVNIQIVNPWPGRLVYVAFRGGNSTLGSCDTNEVSGSEKCHYYQAIPSPQTQGSILYGPLLSPNGRQILLRYGEGYDFSDYLFAVFDLEHNSTRVLGPHARYYSASWSPTGRYIAYMNGGDSDGNNTVTIPTDPPNILSVPLSFQVFDLQTGRDQRVITNDTLTGPFAWKDANTPVYAVLSPEAQRIVKEQNTKRGKTMKKVTPPTDSVKELAPQPNIFAFNLNQSENRMLLQDGYRPLPSPDGSWIAFFGSQNVEKPIPLRPEWTAISTGSALCVAQADGKQRLVLNLFADYPEMLWRKDNLHLLTIENIEGRKDRSKFEGTLKEWNAKTGRFRIVTVLHAYDTGTPDYSLFDPKFRFISISQDGVSAFVVVNENKGDAPHASNLKVSTLESVNLESGDVTVIARVKGSFGTRIDWREQNGTG